MTKKFRAKRERELLQEVSRPPLAQVSIRLSADGAAFIPTFTGGKGHAVRIPVPGNAVKSAGSARSALVAMRDELRDLGTRPTVEQLTTVLNSIRVAEKALIGLTVLESILRARESESHEPKINSRAVPTQALVDAFIAKGGKIETESERADRVLSDKYGLDVNEFVSGLGGLAI